MKVFERVVLSQLQSLVADFLDPLQSACRRGRRVEDAVFHVLHNIDSHLDKPCSYIRLVFNFSSAFYKSSLTYWQGNSKMKVSIWVLDYLTDRLQFFNLALDFPTPCSPTLALRKGLHCHLFFFHCTLPTEGVLTTRARLTSLLTTQG